MQNLHNEAKIESYLESVRKRLDQLPAAERNAELTEVRDHLTELARGHAELGMTEQEAIQTALRQFGDPKLVGTNLRRAWEQGQKRRLPGTVLSAAGWAISISLVMSLISFLIRSILAEATNNYQNRGAVLWNVMLGYWVAGCFQCLLTGYITGRRAPRCAFAGMLLSNGLFSVWSLIAFCLITLPHLPAAVLPVYLRTSAFSISIGLACSFLGVSLGRRRFLTLQHREQASA
jgi:hypothetical protein